jgi:thioredoxin 1
LATAFPVDGALAQMPPAIAAPGEDIVATFQPILSELLAEPKFKNLVYFVVDFDSQKDAVNFFGAQMQSTLIAFKGEHETGRSVGDTDRSSIAALLIKTL